MGFERTLPKIEDDVSGHSLKCRLPRRCSWTAMSWAEADHPRPGNLFRGLEPRISSSSVEPVNRPIREEVIRSIPTSQGLHLQVDEGQVSVLRGIADGSKIPSSLEELWS